MLQWGLRVSENTKKHHPRHTPCVVHTYRQFTLVHTSFLVRITPLPSPPPCARAHPGCRLTGGNGCGSGERKGGLSVGGGCCEGRGCREGDEVRGIVRGKSKSWTPKQYFWGNKNEIMMLSLEHMMCVHGVQEAFPCFQYLWSVLRWYFELQVLFYLPLLSCFIIRSVQAS